MNCSLPLILNQFPPLKRKRLLRWLIQSAYGKKLYHCSILCCIRSLSTKSLPACLPDRRTQIAFSLLHEFGIRMAQNPVYPSLLNAIEQRLMQKG